MLINLNGITLTSLNPGSYIFQPAIEELERGKRGEPL